MVMKLAGCIKHTTTSSVPKDQGKFGSSCHDPFKTFFCIFYHAQVENCKSIYSYKHRDVCFTRH